MKMGLLNDFNWQRELAVCQANLFHVGLRIGNAGLLITCDRYVCVSFPVFCADLLYVNNFLTRKYFVDQPVIDSDLRV